MSLIGVTFLLTPATPRYAEDTSVTGDSRSHIFIPEQGFKFHRELPSRPREQPRPTAVGLWGVVDPQGCHMAVLSLTFGEW